MYCDNQNNNWDKLILRAICFYYLEKKSNIISKWQISIKSYMVNRNIVVKIDSLLQKIPNLDKKNMRSTLAIVNLEQILIKALKKLTKIKTENIYDILDNIAINPHKEKIFKISTKAIEKDNNEIILNEENLDKISAEKIEKLLLNIVCFNDRRIIMNYFYNSFKTEYTKEEVLSIIQKNKHKLKIKNIESIENLINTGFLNPNEKIQDKIIFKKTEKSKKKKLK